MVLTGSELTCISLTCAMIAFNPSVMNVRMKLGTRYYNRVSTAVEISAQTVFQ